MSIEVRNISKTFGTFAALRGVDLTIASGELVALLGPSGSGKTTLLRLIAGLEGPEPGGTILFHDADVGALDARERKVGFVFQHYALFRHMTVFENVAFGLRVLPRRRRPSRAALQEKVLELLRMVQLDRLADRYPSQLSGGQRQRIALARCLAIEPRILLLDEPFGALDAKVRQELRSWLRKLHDQIHLTSVFVTHDQEEAMEVADRIVVMNGGRIEQAGTPDEVFHHPATEFVVNFLGNVNIFRGRVEDGKAHFGTVAVDYSGREQAPAAAGAPANVFVRHRDFDVDVTPGALPSFKATIERVHSAGPRVKLELVSDFGDRVNVELSPDRFRELQVAPGREVFLTPREVRVFLEDYSI